MPSGIDAHEPMWNALCCARGYQAEEIRRHDLYLGETMKDIVRIVFADDNLSIRPSLFADTFRHTTHFPIENGSIAVLRVELAPHVLQVVDHRDAGVSPGYLVLHCGQM